MRRADTTTEEVSFLSQLGLRLRRARAVAGMARRELAVRSGVSERYLAQLESGDGNVSILLIRRLADALAADLHDLIGPPIETGRRGRIALIGPAGPGRGALARSLSDRLAVPLFHLESEAADVALADSGQGRSSLVNDADAACRSLAALVDAHERCVIEVPDAFLLEANAYRLLRSRCLTVWLKAPDADPLMALLGTASVSPERDAAIAELRAALGLRDRLHARADLTLEAPGADPAAVLEVLMPMLAGSGADLSDASPVAT